MNLYTNAWDIITDNPAKKEFLIRKSNLSNSLVDKYLRYTPNQKEKPLKLTTTQNKNLKLLLNGRLSLVSYDDIVILHTALSALEI